MSDAPLKAHEWISFEADHEYRTFVFDVTFLESNWTCIFNNGCQGVLDGDATELAQGCCSYGAHFVDEKDVNKAAKTAVSLYPILKNRRRSARALHRMAARRITTLAACSCKNRHQA